MQSGSGPKWAKLAIVLASSATLMAITGCDDSQSTDKQVLQAVQAARVEQAKGGVENLDQAQAQLQKAQQLASSASSTATKVYATAMLAHAELDNALARISDPAKGIDPGHRRAQQLLWDIRQLADEVRAGHNLAVAYTHLEPKDARAAVQNATQAATGAGDQAWIAGDNTKLAVPSLTSVKADVEKLQNQVQQQQAHIKSLQQQQQQVATQADKELTKADTMSGEAGVQQFTTASNLRKQSEDLATQVEVAQAKLVPMQQDLALAQAREKSISTAIEQFQKLADQLDKGWAGVGQQIKRQQEIALAIVSGGSEGTGSSESIKQKAAELSKQVAQNKAVYDAAAASLTSAIQHFQSAATSATQLASDIQQQMANLDRNNQMRTALETLRTVYTPASFRLDQANAQLALANLQARHVQMLSERQALDQVVSSILGQANLDVPAALADKKLASEIQSAAKESAENFKAANDLFLQSSGGATMSEAEKNGSRVGSIFALYGQALLARATHDPAAAQQLAAAESARDQMLADAPQAISELPAELVPAGATTAPSTAPAGAAPTDQSPAPAPAAPAPGAAARAGAAPAPAAQ